MITQEQLENLALSSRARYITLYSQGVLDELSDWTPPFDITSLQTEHVLYCLAAIYLAKKRSLKVKLMLVNKPVVELVCLVDGKYIIEFDRRDFRTLKYLKEFEQYKPLYISGFNKTDDWVKIIE